MKPTMNMTKIKISVSKGLSAVTPWRAGGVLAVGALLAAGTALYFDMAPGGEAGGPSAIEKIEVASKFTDLDAVDNYLSAEDLLKYVYPEEPGQPRADNPSSNENPKIKHLESQIDSLLADAGLAANLARREDEARATMLRIEAYIAANKATEENAKSHRGGTWPPDTEYYLDPDYSERQTGR